MLLIPKYLTSLRSPVCSNSLRHLQYYWNIHVKKHFTEEEKQKAIEAAEKAIEKAKEKWRPFHYSHQGSLAYIGSDRAIADLPFMNGNVLAFLFAVSASHTNSYLVRQWWCRYVSLLA